MSTTTTKQVVINALPLADFQLPGAVCMPGGQAQFNNLSSLSGGSALSYTWDFGDLTPISSVKDPLHVFASSGSYSIKLQVTSAQGCLKDTTKTFSAFFDKPVGSFTVSPDTLCQGTQNVFTDLSTAPNSTIQTWQWSFGDNTFSATRSPSKIYSNPGNYNITLLVKNAQGCVSDTFRKSVQVYLQPSIDAGPSFTVPSGSTVQFSPVVNDTTLSFAWTPALNLSNPLILRPTLVALTTQVYTLTATGLGKCSANDILTVKVLRPFTIPNVFSPNGDGINDTWQIPNLADYPGAEVEVFTRNGQRVFQSYNYNKAWDGTINGKPLPVATYYYIIDPKNGYSRLTGSVTILK